MTLLHNIHPLLQADIFLAPGSYFHLEYSDVDYHRLPATLKKLHNQQLIQQYLLPWPDSTTARLPRILSMEWNQLPKVALGLGAILHSGALPWWGELAAFSDLRHKYSDPLWQCTDRESPTPQHLLALGAEQLFAYITPFGRAYTERLKYMFSNQTLALIPSSFNAMLPWNIIEETCRYVRKNTA